MAESGQDGTGPGIIERSILKNHRRLHCRGHDRSQSPSPHAVVMTPNPYEIGVGATAELNVRVSVATLVRVLFKKPNNDELMLALERKATLRRTEDGGEVRVKSQPFGGAIRILDLSAMQDLVGDFHFDSARS